MRYLVRFSGRKNGAIGWPQSFSIYLELPAGSTTNDLRLALYDAGYEHIGFISYQLMED